jgi:hypothetical protein
LTNLYLRHQKDLLWFTRQTYFSRLTQSWLGRMLNWIRKELILMSYSRCQKIFLTRRIQLTIDHATSKRDRKLDKWVYYDSTRMPILHRYVGVDKKTSHLLILSPSWIFWSKWRFNCIVLLFRSYRHLKNNHDWRLSSYI